MTANSMFDDDFLNNFKGEKIPPPRKKLKDKLQERNSRDSYAAEIAVSKFLADNPDINIECVIKHIKSQILSTVKCAEMLGISPEAFFRLRKKHNIEPVYIAQNNQRSLKSFAGFISKRAIKNFYTIHQINRIPPEEIELVQMRSARSLKFPNGKNIPVKWAPRGCHSNGKLKAHINHLKKNKIWIEYHAKDNRYYVELNGNVKVLTKREVDMLNLRYGKIGAFT